MGRESRSSVQEYSSVLPTQLETSLLGDSLKTSWDLAKLEVGVMGQRHVRRNYASV